MIERKPDIYSEFSCIADKCKHTCCSSWEIDVDDKTYHDYCEVGGEFGARLRESIKKDKKKYFKMVHGKCPFLSMDQLCEVYQELGEKALCEVCTEYPRFEFEYGNVCEKVLALSCEEVGRILFSHKEIIRFRNEKDATLAADRGAIEVARDYCIHLLQNRSLPLRERLYQFLLFSVAVQNYLDVKQNGSIEDVIAQFEKEEHRKEHKPNAQALHSLFQKRMDILMDMEVMEEEWSEETNNVMRAFYSDSRGSAYDRICEKFSNYYAGHEYEYEHLIVYFAYRYLIEAVSGENFLVQAKFCLYCYFVIKDMDRMRFLLRGQHFTLEDKIDTTRIFCKEVEHSKKSHDYLMEKIIREDVFGVEEMLEQVMG